MYGALEMHEWEINEEGNIDFWKKFDLTYNFRKNKNRSKLIVNLEDEDIEDSDPDD